MRQNTNKGLETGNPRSKIVDIYLETINGSFENSRPAIKLVNFGTGSGKTHQFFQAVIQSIRDNPEIQIIGLYIAPLRENLTVPPPITNENPDIPLYILYSEDWKTTEQFLKRYNHWLPTIRKNHKLWSELTKAAGQIKAAEAGAVLSKAMTAISDYELILRFSTSVNDALKARLLQTQRDITGSLDKFLEIYIKAVPDETLWPEECLELVKIYYPLFLLREKSGILLMTYKKFETEIPYFVRIGGRWIMRKSRFDEYVREYSSDTCRFVMAFDEQEDGYQIMLEEQIDIISPKALAINNALSSIYREFAVLFSGKSEENRAFLRFFRKNPGALREWKEYYEKGKEIDPNLLTAADIFQRLTYLEGNSSDFLLQIAAIDDRIEASFQSIINAFGNFGEEQPVRLDFEKLARVLAAFENNRALVIPHKLYSRYAEDLMNIFSYNNLYIYNIEVLKNLAIQRKNSGHVLIDEISGDEQDTVTVAELIYSILVIRLQIEAVRKLLGAALDADDSQSRSLDIWSRQITRLQNADGNSPATGILQYLDRVYVYQSLKSIINIMEISRYQNTENKLIHDPLREVSIGSTAILTSPEYRILSMLKDTHNVIFFVSATGGVYGDLSTNYDMRYLEDELRDDETGRSSFEPMRDDELALSEQIRSYRRQNRDVAVSFFNGDFSTFPNQQTREVIERFEKSVLKTFLDEQKTEGRWFGTYKIQEIHNFVRFLFYLFEDDSVQQVIAFTQTLTWIRKLVNHAVRVNHLHFVFRATEEHPNIFMVEVRHNSFTSPVRVKLILYESRFNTEYRNKASGRTYPDELVQRKGEKIYFISAYQSASKGFNPTIRVSEDGDQEKDFDAIVLLMDKYFSVMGPGMGKSQDSEKSTTLLHFALMKNLVSLGDTTIEIKDFNRYLSEPEARDFRDLQHQIQLGKGILQSIGRTERRDYLGQTVKIFINDESRKNLVNYYRHLQQKESYELRKLSVNNHEVFQRVMEDERKRTIHDYDGHVFTEIDALTAIQDFRKIMLDQIDRLHEDANTPDIVRQWEMLRDPLVFQDPAAYLEKLRRSGLFPGDFVDSLFYRRTLEQPEFIPYLAREEEGGKSYLIISDSTHGEKVYPYLSRMYPEFLKIGAKGFDAAGDELVGSAGDMSTDQIYRIYRKFIPNPAVFSEYVPRPNFFYDVLYPSLTESIVEAWIQDVIFEGKNWSTIQAVFGIKLLTDFKTYHKLFERFDLFYVRGDALYCIDVKAWSEVSGYRLSQKTIEKAVRKLKEIRTAYPEFSRVSGLLLNLHAPLEKNQKLAEGLTSGNLFYLDENHNPVESTTVRDFLIRRGR